VAVTLEKVWRNARLKPQMGQMDRLRIDYTFDYIYFTYTDQLRPPVY